MPGPGRSPLMLALAVALRRIAVTTAARKTQRASLPRSPYDSRTPLLDGDGGLEIHRRRLNVEINSCLDTADWFPTRNTGGVNLFKTYYDCECSGDLASYYTFACRLEDYCYVDVWNNDTEVCIDQNLTWDFSVEYDANASIGVIDDMSIERGYHCVEYARGGPRARMCRVDGAVCAHRMKSVHGFSTEESASICRDDVPARSWERAGVPAPADGAGCVAFLVDGLGYARERARELCPVVTLDGSACAGPTDRECAERTGGTRDELVIHVSTYDCGNVDPCATPSCQANKVVWDRPGKVFLYPRCDAAEEEEELAEVTPSPSAGTAPGPSASPTREPSGAGGVFAATESATEGAGPSTTGPSASPAGAPPAAGSSADGASPSPSGPLGPPTRAPTAGDFEDEVEGVFSGSSALPGAGTSLLAAMAIAVSSVYVQSLVD